MVLRDSTKQGLSQSPGTMAGDFSSVSLHPTSLLDSSLFNHDWLPSPHPQFLV